MVLAQVVLLCLVAAMVLGLYTTLLIELAPRHEARCIPRPSHVGAGVTVILLVALLCMRSLAFGVDTVAYVDLFARYCSGDGLSDLETSFHAATLTLNALMLGACSTQLLPTVWALAIVIPALALPAPWKFKICYLAAFLLSIVGIELATNALRQGLSVGVMLLCISLHTTQIGPRRWLALPLALAAMLFHSSAILFLTAYFLARLRWRLFLITSIATIIIIVGSLDVNIALPLASDFIYEIQKYAAHDDDELWIRALAFTTVLASLAAPVLARDLALVRRINQVDDPYSIAVRLSLLCVPFLALPYFGYRFIYGTYPIILFLTLSASMLPKPFASGRPHAQFLWLLAMNVLVLLVWSTGSSYMREVPFI